MPMAALKNSASNLQSSILWLRNGRKRVYTTMDSAAQQRPRRCMLNSHGLMQRVLHCCSTQPCWSAFETCTCWVRNGGAPSSMPKASPKVSHGFYFESAEDMEFPKASWRSIKILCIIHENPQKISKNSEIDQNPSQINKKRIRNNWPKPPKEGPLLKQRWAAQALANIDIATPCHTRVTGVPRSLLVSIFVSYSSK